MYAMITATSKECLTPPSSGHRDESHPGHGSEENPYPRLLAGVLNWEHVSEP